MADQSQLERLRTGSESWNLWRQSIPEEHVIDLTGADLRFADLSGMDLNTANLVRADLTAAKLNYAQMQKANLHNANLFGATLTNAALIGANLARADLTSADLNDARLDDVDLTHAVLTGATLVGTKLTSAVLTNANLTRAALIFTDFQHATLTGADLSRANLFEVVFGDVNLSGAVLDSCEHAGPSTVDHRTLLQSGSLPLSFLRGCGLPDRLIEYLPSLVDPGPIQFYSCFISYSTANQDFANRLHADLQSRGIRCWFAPHDMLPGSKIHEQIDEAIRLYDRLLLILSHESMASPWVKTEIARAREKETGLKRHVLFPLSLVPFSEVRAWKQFNADLGEDTALEIREYFLPDFSDWKNHDAYQLSFEKVVRALKSAE